jgi:hypothetical protein
MGSEQVDSRRGHKVREEKERPKKGIVRGRSRIGNRQVDATRGQYVEGGRTA